MNKKNIILYKYIIIFINRFTAGYVTMGLRREFKNS